MSEIKKYLMKGQVEQKIIDILKYELPGLYMTVGWKEGQGFCIYYKNAKREGMSWYKTAKEAMKRVEEVRNIGNF
tara:strand:+ start:588 stop:812 length:225 start_codon:yes stop_codon:yes gene_type:complete